MTFGSSKVTYAVKKTEWETARERGYPNTKLRGMASSIAWPPHSSTLHCCTRWV